MKLTSKNLWIILLVCYSQTIMSMADMEDDKAKVSWEYHIHCLKEPSPKDGRHQFDQGNNDSFYLLDFDLRNPQKHITDLEKRLIKIQRATDSIQKQENDKHEFRVIAYGENMPQYYGVMLHKIIQQQTLPQNVSLIASSTGLCYLHPNNEPSPSSIFTITMDNQFVKRLSLVAQEAWCTYLVHVAMNRSENFTHDNILSDEINQQLFIALAAKNSYYASFLNILVTEAIDIPIELYAATKRIKKFYENIAWLKTYAV